MAYPKHRSGAVLQLPDELVSVSFEGLLVTVPEPGAIGPTSGAWSRTMVVTASGDVRVSLDYRMRMGEGFEADEFGEFIIEIDGVRWGRDVHDSLVHLQGATGNLDTGWLSAQFLVPQLVQAEHVITLGAFNNQATDGDEFVEVYIDNLVVELSENMLLGAGQTVLVVADRAAFESRYGLGHDIAGEYAAGKLSNGGEQLRVREPRGGVIHEFSNDDGGQWPQEPDGRGSTLEVIDASGDYNSPSNWRASSNQGGSPGSAIDPRIVVDIDGDELTQRTRQLALVAILQGLDLEDLPVATSTLDLFTILARAVAGETH